MVTLERMVEMIRPEYPDFIDEWVKDYGGQLQMAVNYFNSSLLSESEGAEEQLSEYFFDYIFSMGILGVEMFNEHEESRDMEKLYPEVEIINDLGRAYQYAIDTYREWWEEEQRKATWYFHRNKDYTPSNNITAAAHYMYHQSNNRSSWSDRQKRGGVKVCP
jgi:hypothetical protein